MATNREAPSSQAPDSRPLAFMLDGGVDGASDVITLYVRPEDLTRQDPSRVNVVQTLGGAWADSFGAGVPMITISGNTGWRRDQNNEDGEKRFLTLREKVFSEWHSRRAEAVAAGQDPSGVRLVFVDALDNFSATVAPLSFVLRRSKSRPLLVQYQIQMAVLDDGTSFSSSVFGVGALADLTESLGLDSLSESINRVVAYVDKAKSFIDREILGPVQGFMRTTAQIYQKVYAGIKSVEGVASSLIRVAQTTAQAGVNLFRTLSAVAGLPAYIKGQIIDVATAYANIFCLMRNALKSRAVYQDYSSLYGSSNCSSTSGGAPISPLIGVNAFTVSNPAPKPPVVSVAPAARAGMEELVRSDVVLSPMSVASVGRIAGLISSGVALA